MFILWIARRKELYSYIIISALNPVNLDLHAHVNVLVAGL